MSNQGKVSHAEDFLKRRGGILMKRLTAFLTGMMLLASIAALPAQAVEKHLTDEQCQEILECRDCYVLGADGV